MDKGSDTGCSVPAYLFEVGDVVKVKPDGQGTQQYLFDNSKEAKAYKDNLTVVYRYFNGCDNVYIVTPGEGGVSLRVLERMLALQYIMPRYKHRRFG